MIEIQAFMLHMHRKIAIQYAIKPIHSKSPDKFAPLPVLHRHVGSVPTLSLTTQLSKGQSNEMDFEQRK